MFHSVSFFFFLFFFFVHELRMRPNGWSDFHQIWQTGALGGPDQSFELYFF